MVWSFILLIIALILRIGIEELALTYDFILSWIIYFDWVLIGTAVVFVFFVLIYIAKAIKK